MKNYKIYHFYDKSKWPEGEWQEEPDEAEWIDDETGYDCLVRRNPDFGHLFGYVGVKYSHPFYKNHYCRLENINVHGGLTYSNYWTKYHEKEKDLWWFGFDCLHNGDFSPNDNILRSGKYRNFEYVQNQIKLLAKQLKKCEENNK